MLSAIEDEQAFVDDAYATLVRQITYLNGRITGLKKDPAVGTVQDEIERQAQFDNLAQQLKAAEAAGNRLCFGRIDTQENDTLHVLMRADESSFVERTLTRAPEVSE